MFYTIFNYNLDANTMKLIKKLKKAYPQLKKGLSSDFDSCVLGVSACETMLIYDRDLIVEKLQEIGTIEGHTEAEEYVYWFLSSKTDCVILNMYYQGG